MSNKSILYRPSALTTGGIDIGGGLLGEATITIYATPEEKVESLRHQLAAAEQARQEAKAQRDRWYTAAGQRQDELNAAEATNLLLREALGELIAKYEPRNEGEKYPRRDSDEIAQARTALALPSHSEKLRKVVEVSTVLKDFALTAPGRLPERVELAIESIREWEGR